MNNFKVGDYVTINGYKGIYQIASIKRRWIPQDGGNPFLEGDEEGKVKGDELPRMIEAKQVASSKGKPYRAKRSENYGEGMFKPTNTFIEKEVTAYLKYIDLLNQFKE